MSLKAALRNFCTGQVTLSQRFLLGIGESVSSTYVIIAGFYLNAFFLEQACLSPAYVGIIQLVQGTWDTVNDPLLGFLSDKTRCTPPKSMQTSPWLLWMPCGRRRPWLFGAAFPMAIFYFGVWQELTFTGLPDWAKTAYYCVMLLGISGSLTAIQVQIGALVPELTSDYDERLIVSVFRLAIGQIIALTLVLIFGAAKLVFDATGTTVMGYRFLAGVVAVIMFVNCMIAAFCLREKFDLEDEAERKALLEQENGGHAPPCTEQLSNASSNCIQLCNVPFVCVVLMYLCGPIGIVLVQSNLLLWSKYVIGDEGALYPLMVTVLLGAAISAPIWTAAATLPVSCARGAKVGADGKRAVGDVVEAYVPNVGGAGFAQGWLQAKVVKVFVNGGAVELGEVDGLIYGESSSATGKGTATGVEYDIEFLDDRVLKYTLALPDVPSASALARQRIEGHPFVRGTRVTAQFKNVHHDGVVFDHDPLSETYTLLFPDGDVRVAFRAANVSMVHERPSIERNLASAIARQSIAVIPTVGSLDDFSTLERVRPLEDSGTTPSPFPVKTVVNVLVEKAGDSKADIDGTDANAAAGGVREAEGDDDDVAERGDVSSLIIEGEDDTFEDEDPLEVSATPKDLQLEILDDHHRPASASSVVDSTASAAEETAINSSPAQDGLLVYDRLGMKRRIIEKYVRTPRVSCSLGKKGSYLVGGSIMAVSMFMLVFPDQLWQGSSNAALATALPWSVLIGLCFGIAYVIPYGMLPDVIEEDEIATGLRREGIFMGMFTFFLKAGVTIALMCTNFALEASGYKADTETCTGGATYTNGTVVAATESQTEMTRWVLKALVGPIPAVFFAIAIVASIIYPVTRKRHLESEARLREIHQMEREDLAAHRRGSGVAESKPLRRVSSLFRPDTTAMARMQKQKEKAMASGAGVQSEWER